MNVPLPVGVPLMEIVFAANTALTPAGKSIAAPIPVAPVVACVMLVSGVLIHRVGLEEAGPTVLSGVTIMVPVAFTVPQPPVSGIM